MRLAHSIWRKLAITTLAALAFVSLDQVTMLDSKYAARQAAVQGEVGPAPFPGSRLQFGATAYCKGTTTASGVAVKSGVAAADPDLLPVGSVVEVDSLEGRYSGIYTIMDTGPQVQGRQIDIYMWSCNEALRFGRRLVRVTVLRLGWNPKATRPRLIDAPFRRDEQSTQPLPARALPLTAAPVGVPPQRQVTDR